MNINKVSAAVLSLVLGVAVFVITLRIDVSQHYSDFIVGSIAWYAGNKFQDLAVWPVSISVSFLGFVILSKFISNFGCSYGDKVSSRFKSQLFFKDFGKISAAVPASVLGAAACVIALKAENKIQYLAVWSVFLLVFFLAFIFLSKIISTSRSSYGAVLSSSLESQLILWSVPFYADLGALFLGGAIDSKTIAISALGIVFIGFVSFVIKKNGDEIKPDLLSVTFLIVILISLIPIELGLLIGRAPIGVVDEINPNVIKKAGYLLVAFGFVVGVHVLINYRERLKRNLPRIIFLSQVGLPFFFLTLYPARLLQPSGELTSYDTTIYLKIFVVGLVIFSLYDVIKRFRAHFKGDSWENLFSPLALFGLLVALKIGNTIAPHISPDDYHFGESLLGWWGYMKGAIPYVDYIPPHGLIEDDLRLFLCSIFYDGSAACVAEAGRLALTILGFAAFISIYYYSASIALSFTVVLLLGGRMGWFFLIPFICLWVNSSLRGKPAKWLMVWMLTSPIVILGLPPQGILLVTASGVIVAKLSFDLFRFGDKRSFAYIVPALALLLLLCFVTPLLSMLLGAILYVLENGPINQIAYGIPWSLSWGGRESGFIFEAIRMSWVAVVLFCLYIILRKWREFKESQSLLYPAILFFLFILLMIPYSMGRIDPGGLSRAGLTSIFSWVVMFPLLALGFFHTHARVAMLLIVAFASSFFGIGNISYSSLISSASAAINTAQMRDAAKYGLLNVGKAYMDDSQWDRITRLNALLNSRLCPEDAYLDLTSRNAHYFYVNRLPVISVTAPYNLVSTIRQKHVVRNINNLPEIAILKADNIVHDGGGLALRNPYLYRFIIENYVPRFEKGFIVGYKRLENVDALYNEITVEIKNITDDNWVMGISRYEPAFVLSDPLLVSMLTEGYVRLESGELRKINKVSIEHNAVWIDGGPLSPSESGYPNTINIVSNTQVIREYHTSLFYAAFSVSDYQKIPVAWGKSEDSLKKKMKLVKSLDVVSPTFHHLSSENGNYKVNGVDPQLSFNISGFDLSGQDAGLLRFDFSCAGKSAEPRLQVFWWGDEREGPFESSSVRFSADDGTLIVPLDASPWWLGLERIKGIRIDLDNENACKEFTLQNIGFYQRVF